MCTTYFKNLLTSTQFPSFHVPYELEHPPYEEVPDQCFCQIDATWTCNQILKSKIIWFPSCDTPIYSKEVPNYGTNFE